MKARAAFLSIAILVLVLFCVVPFASLYSRLDFATFQEAFASDLTGRAILSTTLLSTLVTLISLVVALPLAWLMARTDFPNARKFRSLLSLPFAIPPYIGAIAWIFLANPTTGALNVILHSFGFQSALNVYSFTGLVLVEASFLYAVAYLALLTSFDRIDSSLEEAARLSGASAWQVFRDIHLPLLRPAIISSSLVIFLATAASFGVPALIGGPARIYVLTTQIYTFQKMGSQSGLLKASALSALLMGVAVLGLILARFAERSFGTVSGKTPRPSLYPLGRAKGLTVALVLLFSGVIFFLPLGGILFSSFSKIQGNLDFSNLTFGNWTRTLFEVDETGRAIANSMGLGAAAASLAVLIGFFVAYAQVKTKLPGRGLLDFIVSLPYAAPGTVVALALIITFGGNFLGIFPSLYGTLALVGIAYVVKYLNFAVRTAADGYRQIDPVLAEAARVSGAGWTTTLRTIWLPLLRPALIAGWFLIFMPAVSELTMTVLLTGPGHETIGTLIFQLQDYADAGGGGASVLGAVVVAIVILINFAVRRLSGGRYGL